MAGQKPIVDRFTEALGEGVESSFNSLAFEIMKESAISSKDKTLIALACSVAVRCEHCVKRHKEIARKAGASQRRCLRQQR
jgi:AhpD family alkylhydroperoxidase